MRKRFIAAMMIFCLLVVQGLPEGQGVKAQSNVEVDVAMEVELEVGTGYAQVPDDRLLIFQLSRFRLNYRVKNGEGEAIEVLEIYEELVNRNNDVLTYSNPEGTISAGASRNITGRSYIGVLEHSPYTMKYRIRYKTTGSEDIRELQGQKIIRVIDTRLQAEYHAEFSQPVFRDQPVRYVAELESLANIDLYNVRVSDSVLGELGRIDVFRAGSRETLEHTFRLQKTTESHLVVTYDDPLGIRSSITQPFHTRDLRVEVSEEDSVAQISLTGSADKSFLPAGGEVVFTFQIRNSGNSPLVQVESYDWNGNIIDTRERLQPGEEVTFTHSAVIEPDTPYEFSVRAAVEASGQIILSEVTIAVNRLEPQVEIYRIIHPDIVRQGEQFTITYTIRNGGNIGLTDILLMEPELGEVGRFDLLEAGDEISIAREFTAEGPGVSRTVLTALDKEMGTGYRYEAGDMTIPVEVEDGLAGLFIELSADEDVVLRTGTLEIECILRNTGTMLLHDLTLSLMDRDIVIDNIPVLLPGEERSISLPPMEITQTETFRMEASGFDGNENPVSFTSNELTLHMDSGQGRATLLRVLLIVILLVVLFLAGTLYYLIKGPIKLPIRRKKRSHQA